MGSAVTMWVDNNANARKTYGDISQWQTSGVTDMKELFYYKKSFNGNIANWDVSRVTNMYYMFNYAESFNQNISGWNTGKVTNMSLLFYNAMSFNQNLCTWYPNFPNGVTFFMFDGSGCPNKN